jgi:hypothetical protein
MRCPKCQFDHELQTIECLKCGIVFSRYRPAPETTTTHPAAAVALAAPVAVAAKQTATAASIAMHLDHALAIEADLATAPANDRSSAVKELKYRILAIPVALLMARLIAGTGFRVASSMLAMVLHESGHAITAWLTGRWAVPLLWVTPHGQQRSWLIVMALAGGIVFGGYVAWRAERWAWVAVAGAALLLQLIVLSLHSEGALIVFFGEGGAMVLATALMASFYAPRESWLRRSWGLRWGLLAIGALSFVHVFLLWTGPWENLPFGEIEGVNMSDPSLLTEMYGWPVTLMVDRYIRLGKICLAVLGAVYVWGLVTAYLDVRARRASG